MPSTPSPPAPALPRWWLHGGFGLLALLALYFSTERTFADAAYYLARVVDSGWFQVEHQRLVLVIAEFPALVAAWAGAPMNVILIVHSVGHVVLAWCLAAWLQRSGEQTLALGVLLVQVVGQQWLFFSPQYEIAYGAWAAFPLLMLWRRGPMPHGGRPLLWAVLAVLLLTSHPEHLATYAAVALLGSQGRRWTKWSLALALAPVVVLTVVKSFLLSDYERGKFSLGLHIDHRLLDPGYWDRVAHLLLLHYPLLLLLAAFMVVTGIARKRYLVIAVAVGSTLLLLPAVGVVADGSEFSRNTSSLYFPWVAILLLTACSIHDWAEHRLAWGVALALLLGFNAWTIVRQGNVLQKRTALIGNFCKECLGAGSQKCVVDENEGPSLYGTWEWSLPMESMLLSKAYLGHTVNIVTPEDLAFRPGYSELPDSMVLFRRWDPRSVSSFGQGRFSDLKAGPYVRLP